MFILDKLDEIDNDEFRLDSLRVLLFCFFLKGFEEGDHEDDDKDKGGHDSAGLQGFEFAGPQEGDGRERLNGAFGGILSLSLLVIYGCGLFALQTVDSSINECWLTMRVEHQEM